MDTTYTWQWQDPDDGSWHFYSQREYDTESEAREFAERTYSDPHDHRAIRIVKITRTVVEVTGA